MATQISVRSVYWSKKYESIVNKLTGRDREDRRRAFENNMHVLVFAAFLGMKYKISEKLASDRLEVPTDVFINNNMTQALLLIGLLHTKDGNVLREDRDADLVSIFQDYANGGLSLIQKWLDEKPTDIYGDLTLMAKITEEMNSKIGSSDFNNRENISIEF